MVERIEVLQYDDAICIMYVDYSSRTIKIQNLIEPVGWNAYMLPFGKELNPTWWEYKHFLESRCFPANRANAKDILKLLGLDKYDPDKIVRITNGVMNDDFIWLRYPGQKLKFEDVRIR